MAAELEDKMHKSPNKKEAAGSQNPTENAVSPSPRKRSKAPRLQVVGARIYDNVNGKTCHQCRQKTMDFTATCKNLRNDKPCPNMFCHKCLLNRYGEKAEEVTALDDWKCPKCRCICNCSICRKKGGQQPTGILINKAKATGYSSVSEFLLNGGEKVVGNAVGSASGKEVIVSSRKRGKENSLEGQIPDSKNSKKMKSHKLNEKSDGLGLKNSEKTDAKEASPRKSNNSETISNHKAKTISNHKAKFDNEVDPPENKESQNSDSNEDLAEPYGNAEGNEGDNNIEGDVNLQQADLRDDALLPQGTELTHVGGVDVKPKDVGNALQFLEFCAAFAKILDVKEWQPGLVLQDLLHGRTARRGKFSLTIQFHMHLLSLILDEEGEDLTTLSPSDGESSWFNALKKCFSGQDSVPKTQALETLNNAADYETLNASEKLEILNVLCDELLGTAKMRTWIDEENEKFSEKKKEAKMKVVAAKDKEKSLKQKMKDDIAKALIEKQGAPLSISEHDAIVSKIKTEAADAHAKMLESQGFLSEQSQVSNAVRLQPLFRANNGHLYWRLSCKLDMLHQDIGESRAEKWFGLDAEEKEVVEKNISRLRGKRARTCRALDVLGC